MPSPDSDLKSFSTLVEALRPWLGQIIFVGGWAHRLYRERPDAASVTYAPLRTDDADVALDPRTIRKSGSIRDRLREFAFEEQLLGSERPPVTHYGLGAKNAGFYVEFLTPLVGGERRRDGSPDVTERVAGVVAQKLRYLELLLIAPWWVNATREAGFELSEPATLQIANPASYVVQKLLIHDQRKPLDRAKDVLHVHDTIELFATSLPALNEIWRTSISPTLSRSVARRVQAQREKMFGAVTDTIRETALMAGTRRLTPTAIQEACLAGLERLLQDE